MMKLCFRLKSIYLNKPTVLNRRISLEKCFLVFVLYIATVLAASAAEWNYTGEFTGAGSMNSYSNWQSGESDALSLTGKIELHFDYKSNANEWKNTVKSALGITKLEGQDYRKSEDNLSVESIFEHALSDRLRFYWRFAAETTWMTSYVYYSDPVDAVFSDGRPDEFDTKSVKISRGFEPLNLDQGTGIKFRALLFPDDIGFIDVRAGLGARELIASDYYIEKDDETTDVKEFETVDDYTDLGGEFGVDLKYNVAKNIHITSTGNAFYGFGDAFWKIQWNSAITIDISKHLGLSLGSEMLYDENVYSGAQWKTSTLVTVSYKLL